MKKARLGVPWWSVVRIQGFHCHGPGSTALISELRSLKTHGTAKNKKEEKHALCSFICVYYISY